MREMRSRSALVRDGVCGMTEPSVWLIEYRPRKRGSRWSRDLKVDAWFSGAKAKDLAEEFNQNDKVNIYRAAEYRRVADAPREPGRTIEPREE